MGGLMEPHRLKSVLLKRLVRAFFLRRGSEGDLFGDGEAVAFEGDDLPRVIREHS